MRVGAFSAHGGYAGPSAGEGPAVLQFLPEAAALEAHHAPEASGVGLETARQLAGQGGEIVMIVRDQARGQDARSQVAEAATGKAPVLLAADLSVQADIRRVAHEVTDRYDHVDILVNNAGAAFSRREQSADGLKLTWATNYLAPFLL